jgi:hypothetical protein
MVTPKLLCELCGAELDRRCGSCQPDVREEAAAAGVLDDLAAAVWVQGYDAAWLSQDWVSLEKHLAADVALMLPGSCTTISGRAAVLAHIRAMMRGARVHEYNATDLSGYTAGTIGVITYRWQLDWTVDHKRREISGRDVLVLRQTPAAWQLVWRAEAPRAVGADWRSSVEHARFRAVTA